MNQSPWQQATQNIPLSWSVKRKSEKEKAHTLKWIEISQDNQVTLLWNQQITRNLHTTTNQTPHSGIYCVSLIMSLSKPAINAALLHSDSASPGNSTFPLQFKHALFHISVSQRWPPAFKQVTHLLKIFLDTHTKKELHPCHKKIYFYLAIPGRVKRGRRVWLYHS